MKPQKIIFLFSIMFVFSLLFELVFSFLYDLSNTTLFNHSGVFALIDIIILGIIFGIVSLASWNIKWLNKPQVVDQVLIIVLGIFGGQMIEKWNLGWSYNKLMPVVFNIGVIGFVKYPLIFLLSLWVVGKIRFNK